MNSTDILFSGEDAPRFFATVREAYMIARTAGRRIRYLYFPLLWLLFFTGYLARANYIMVLPLIRAHFGMDYTTAGLSAGVLFLGYLLFQSAGAKPGVAWGCGKALLAGLLVCGLMTALTGLVPTLAAMFLVRALLGAGQTLQPASAWALLVRWFPRAEWTRVNTVVLSSIAMAGVISPLLVTAVLRAGGWQVTFFATAVLYLLLALAVLRWFRDRPEDHPDVTACELAEIRQGSYATPASDPASRPGMLRLLASPGVPSLVCVYFLQSYALWGFATWLPSYLAEERGLGMIGMGLKLPVVFGAALLGMVLVGPLLDRLFHRRIRLFLSSVWIVGALGIFYGHTAGSVTLSVANFALGSAFGIFMFINVFWQLPREVLPHPVFMGTSGLLVTASQLAGFVAPVALGWLIDNSPYRWDAAFMTVEAALILAAGMVLLVPHAKRAESRDRTPGGREAGSGASDGQAAGN